MSARDSKIRLGKALAASWLGLALVALPITWWAWGVQTAKLTAELVKSRAEAAAKDAARLDAALGRVEASGLERPSREKGQGRLWLGGEGAWKQRGAERIEKLKTVLDDRLIQEGFAFFAITHASGEREEHLLQAKGDSPLALELRAKTKDISLRPLGSVEAFAVSTGKKFVAVAYSMEKNGKTARFDGIYEMPQSLLDAQRRGMGWALGLIALSTLALAALLWPVVTRLGKTVEDQKRGLLEANLELMDALGSSIASRDSDTHEHNYRVTLYSVWLAQRAGLPAEMIRGLIAGAFLHDVGKIGIPDAILLKPGKLDEEEFRIMKTHVEIGEKIVKKSNWLRPAKRVVGGHHEKWNGKGYPRGIKGEAIPIEARIFAIADVFDALTSKRPYKEPWTVAAALEQMAKDSGEHFDPRLFGLFEKRAGEWKSRLESLPLEKMEKMLEKAVARYWFDGAAEDVSKK